MHSANENWSTLQGRVGERERAATTKRKKSDGKKRKEKEERSNIVKENVMQ